MDTHGKIPEYGLQHPELYKNFLDAYDDPAEMGIGSVLQQACGIAYSLIPTFNPGIHSIERARAHRAGSSLAAASLVHTLLTPINELEHSMAFLKNDTIGAIHTFNIVRALNGFTASIHTRAVLQNNPRIMMPYIVESGDMTAVLLGPEIATLLTADMPANEHALRVSSVVHGRSTNTQQDTMRAVYLPPSAATELVNDVNGAHTLPLSSEIKALFSTQ